MARLLLALLLCASPCRAAVCGNADAAAAVATRHTAACCPNSASVYYQTPTVLPAIAALPAFCASKYECRDIQPADMQQKVLDITGVSLSNADVTTTINEADFNNDGTLTWDDLDAFMRAHQVSATPSLAFLFSKFRLNAYVPASDPAYLLPDGPSQGEPYGGYAVEIRNAGAKVYIGTEHIARHDTVYRNCLGIGAYVDMSMKRTYQEEKWPHVEEYPTGRSYLNGVLKNSDIQVYPYKAGVAPTWDTRRLPQSLFWDYRAEITAFIDTQLGLGISVIIYEPERACGVSAAMGIAYLMEKGSAFQPAYDLIAAKQPCISEILTTSEFIDKLNPTR